MFDEEEIFENVRGEERPFGRHFVFQKRRTVDPGLKVSHIPTELWMQPPPFASQQHIVCK